LPLTLILLLTLNCQDHHSRQHNRERAALKRRVKRRVEQRPQCHEQPRPPLTTLVIPNRAKGPVSKLLLTVLVNLAAPRIRRSYTLILLDQKTTRIR